MVKEMADKLTKQKRSENMSKIHGKDTSLEIKVRKYLYHHGFRYRKNVSDLPGRPDILISKYRTVIFVNGCFWHHHHGCKLATIPKSNTKYWKDKIDKNVKRDIRNIQLLEQMEYHVIIVWECEIKECFELRMENLISEIKEYELFIKHDILD